jgi:hypothetical protein
MTEQSVEQRYGRRKFSRGAGPDGQPYAYEARGRRR